MAKKLLALLVSLVLIVTCAVSVPFFTVAEEEAESTGFESMIIGGAFESADDMPKVTNQKKYTIEHDTETTYNGSAGAFKITMDGFRKSRVFSLSNDTVAGSALEKNMEGKYKASIKIKAAEGTTGAVYFCLKQNGNMIKGTDGMTTFYAAGADGAVELSTEWKEYTNSSYILTEQGVITAYVFLTGTGTVWIDEFTLIPDPDFVPNNNYLNAFGDFENGVVPDHWSSLNEDGEVREIIYDEETESKVLHLGRHEPSVRPNSDGGNLFVISGHKALDPKETFKLKLDIKTVGLTDANAFGVMVLVWTYDPETGKSGTQWLKVYGLEKFMTMTGDNDWNTYSINISGFPSTMTSFTMYFRLEGHGDVYIDNVSLTVKERADVAPGVVGADTDPGELNAGDIVKLYTAADEENIYYTLDGTDPKTSDTAIYYHDKAYGIQISEDTVIKAFAWSEEQVGDVYEFAYTVKNENRFIPDDKLLPHVSSKNVSLDTSAAKVGGNSMKLVGNGSELYASTGQIGIDSKYDYKLSFWVKTEGLNQENTGYVNLFLHGMASLENNELGEGGQYYKSRYEMVEIAQTQDWTYYEVELTGLYGNYTALSVAAGINKDFGTMWVDGITLTAMPYSGYPITVKSVNQTFGNNYFESLYSSFVIEQGVLFTNSSTQIEKGVATFVVYDESNTSDILAEGDIDLVVLPGGTQGAEINLSMIAKYGTFRIDFMVTNEAGVTYNAGFIRLARLRDNSDLSDTKFGFSLNMDVTDHDYVDKVGAHTVRVDLDWEDVEATENVYKIDAGVLNNIKSMSEKGIDVIVILNAHDWPSWYKTRYRDEQGVYVGSSGFPRSEGQMKDFLEYVEFVMKELKDYTKYYELFNETNYMNYSLCTGEEYVELMKYIYEPMHKIDPDCKLIVGGMASAGPGDGTDDRYCSSIFKAGGAEYMDIFSFHPYIYPYSPESVDWAGQMQAMYDIMCEYGGEDIPIWITEMGWTATKTAQGVTEEEKMNYFTRTFAWMDYLGVVERNVMYRAESSGVTSEYNFESQWGILKNHGGTEATSNPVGVALNNFVYLNTMYKYSERLDITKGLYTFKYAGNENSGNRDMYMLWTNDTDYLANITVSGGSVRLVDIYGNAVSTSVENNMFSNAVSGSPIYVILEKGETITSVELFNPDGSEIKTPTEDNGGSNGSTTSGNTSGSGSSYYSGNSASNAGEETTTTVQQVKKQKKVVKKIVSKGTPAGTDANWLPIVIVAVAAVLAAAIAVFLIIFLKKKKKNKQQTA